MDKKTENKQNKPYMYKITAHIDSQPSNNRLIHTLLSAAEFI